MHFDLNVNTVLESVAVAGILWIASQLSALKGIKVWQEQHEKQDNDRHDMVMALLNQERR